MLLVGTIYLSCGGSVQPEGKSDEWADEEWADDEDAWAAANKRTGKVDDLSSEQVDEDGPSDEHTEEYLNSDAPHLGPQSSTQPKDGSLPYQTSSAETFQSSAGRMSAHWQDALPGVVAIQAVGRVGSGFRIGPSSVLTNYHVVEQSVEQHKDRAVLIFYTYNANSPVTNRAVGQVTAILPEYDLALITASGLGAIPVLRLGSCSVGDNIWAVGFPGGVASITVTRGIISSIRRTQSSIRWLQIDAELDVGNSGGPILNQAGHFVGVATAVIPGKHTSMRLAVPGGLVPSSWLQ